MEGHGIFSGVSKASTIIGIRTIHRRDLSLGEGHCISKKSEIKTRSLSKKNVRDEKEKIGKNDKRLPLHDLPVNSVKYSMIYAAKFSLYTHREIGYWRRSWSRGGLGGKEST